MKSVFISMTCMLVLAGTALGNMPNEKVLKTFQAAFANAGNVKWFDHQDYYEVSFTQPDLFASIKYDKNGNQLSSKKYYNELQLPPNILASMKKKYPDNTIFGVTEITELDKVTYYVKMDDGKNWITVKVNANGQAQFYEKVKKAK